MLIAVTLGIAYVSVGLAFACWAFNDVKDTTVRDRVQDTLFIAAVTLMWPPIAISVAKGER